MRTGEHRRIKRPDGTELHIELYGPANAQPIVLLASKEADVNERGVRLAPESVVILAPEQSKA
jgi:hypothetical protein